jgi:hypothetical protein
MMTRWGAGAEQVDNDDVVELGDPKAIEGAGGELDTATGKDWVTVLGADVAREMVSVHHTLGTDCALRKSVIGWDPPVAGE